MDWLIGHLVGDYLVQNDYLAQGKKESSVICAVHCLFYALSVWLFTFWPLWVIGVVFLTHFIIDRGNLVRQYMSFVGQDNFAQPPLGPWSVIVVDNVIHLLILYYLSPV